MYYKTIIVDRTFAAGVAVGSLRAFLAHSGSGEATVVRAMEGAMEVEIAVHNPLTLRYAEEQLAAYV